jgi:hypothetical protein
MGFIAKLKLYAKVLLSLRPIGDFRKYTYINLPTLSPV